MCKASDKRRVIIERNGEQKATAQKKCTRIKNLYTLIEIKCRMKQRDDKMRPETNDKSTCSFVEC